MYFSFKWSNFKRLIIQFMEIHSALTVFFNSLIWLFIFSYCCLWSISSCRLLTKSQCQSFKKNKKNRPIIRAKPLNFCIIILEKWVEMLQPLAPMCPWLFLSCSYHPWVLLTLLIFPSHASVFQMYLCSWVFFVSEKFIPWHFYLDIRVHPVCQKQHLA